MMEAGQLHKLARGILGGQIGQGPGANSLAI